MKLRYATLVLLSLLICACVPDKDIERLNRMNKELDIEIKRLKEINKRLDKIQRELDKNGR